MNTKKTILLVHNYYQVPGGEDTVVANEKAMLEEQGHKVILYSRNNSELKSFSVIRKILLPLTTIFNPRTYRDIREIIKKEDIDIVHVHNTLNLVSPAVYYAARSLKIPVVQTIHNFRLLCPAATFYRDGHICEDCLSKGLMCAVKHNCYRESKIQTLVCVVNTWIHRVTGIYGKLNYICLTDFNKQKLLLLKQVKEKQVYVKPNFTDVKEQKIIPYKQRKDQFVFVGRLDKLKGIDFLLKTWKSMGKDAPKLIVCGTGPMREWCENYIAENNLTNVECLGFVPNEAAKRIMAESKALILPTQWYEGFPMTIVEAYSVGTPVIGPDMGNVGDVIKNWHTGCIYLANDGYELSNCVKNCKDFTETILEEYKEKYTKKRNYDVLLMIYKKIGK